MKARVVEEEDFYVLLVYDNENKIKTDDEKYRVYFSKTNQKALDGFLENLELLDRL